MLASADPLTAILVTVVFLTFMGCLTYLIHNGDLQE